MKELLLNGCLIILSFGCFISLLTAQKVHISGYVKASETGETLIGATVYNSELENAAITNEYGFYSIQVPIGETELRYAYIGYDDLIQAFNTTEDISFTAHLTNEAVNLEEVVVVFDDEDRKIQSADMSVNEINAETIKQIPVVLGEVDLVKSIQLLPGVTSNGESSNGFNVRGGSEDQNLVLLDEAIIYNSAHVLGFFSVFNNDAIKDVKLYKGGIPARFGGRIASVLDVRQNDGSDQKIQGTGGIGLISSRLMIEGPLKKDKASFLIAGRTSYVDLFLKVADNPNRLRFYDVNSKINWELSDKNQLFLSGYFGNDYFSLPDLFENAYGNETANLRWNHVFSSKLFSNLSVIYSKYNYNLDFATFKFKWDSGIENLNVKYDVDWYASKNIDLKLGASVISYEFNPGEIMPTGNNSSINYDKLENKYAFESGVYAQVDQDISKRFTANYGLRVSNFYRLGGQSLNLYENNQAVTYDDELEIYKNAAIVGTQQFDKGEKIASFNRLEPRIALAYQLRNNQSMKASYNRTVQYIHLITNSSSPTPFDIWTPSGKYFQPQMADQFALGYFTNFSNKMFSLEAETYYKSVRNRLDYIDGAELIANKAIEREILVGESKAYGAELLIRKNRGLLTGWLAYTYSKTQQKTTGGNIGGLGINEGKWYYTNYDRPHDISLTGAYELNDKWSLAGNMIYQTGRPITYPDGQFNYQNLNIVSYGPRNSNRLPDYHRLDISATLTPRKNDQRAVKREWVFGLYNAYDRRNASSITFRQNPETGENESVKLTVFGIVPSITWNFKF